MNEKIVNHILFYCGGIKTKENVLLIFDKKTEKFKKKFMKVMKKRKLNFNVCKTQPLNSHGKNLGAKIGKLMNESDITLCLTKSSFAHSKERLNAEKKGKRFLSLANYNSKKINFNSILAPFKQYSKKAKKLKSLLDKGNSIKVFSNEGTNLTANIKKREANFCPGYVDKKILLGSPPDAETNISPIENQSNGNIIIDGSVANENIGKIKSKLKLKILNGKIKNFSTIDVSLKKKIKNLFNKKNKKRKILAEIGFGFNKKSKVTGHMLCDEGAYGCVHFGFGSNFTVGGKNKVDFHIDMIVKKPIVYVDNKLILKNNIYKI
jgi:leucyl aminopeptidase (aminopeptidase T)